MFNDNLEKIFGKRPFEKEKPVEDKEEKTTEE